MSLRLKSWHENCRLFCWMRLMFCPLFRYGFEKTREKSCNNKQTKFDCILYGLLVPLAQSTWILSFFLQFSLNKLCLGCYILLFFLFVFAPPIGVIAKRDRGGHGRNCVFAVCHGFAFLTEKFEKLSPVVSCCHKPDICKIMVIALTLRH